MKEMTPIIKDNEATQFDMHINIHSGLLKTINSTSKIKINAPTPNTIISFLTKDIVSSAIIDTPPK